MSDEFSQKDVLSILTEDVQAHRTYIQSLYRNAVYVGGGVLLGGVALATWLLGNQLDASLLQHQIDDALKAKVDQIVANQAKEASDRIANEAEEALSSANERIDEAGQAAIQAAREEVDKYASTVLTDELRDIIQPQLDELANASLSELAANASLPKGLVAAFLPGDFGARVCPVGWSLFSEASGRFLLGAQENKYDPGTRGGEETVTLVIGQMPAHRHGIPMVTLRDATYSDVGTGANTPYFDYRKGSDVSLAIGASSPDTGVLPAGADQPHNNMPPYIAAYFCKKD